MDRERLNSVIAQIDAIHVQDPNLMDVDGRAVPVGLYHAQRRTEWIEQMAGDAVSEALLIAARGQHISRWEIPRDAYERNRTGYLQWRTDLKKMHGEKTAVLMASVGYDEAMIERVRDLIMKKRLKQDADAQMLEDALCLVFLETQFTTFARKEADKIEAILRKTWKKMSAQGHELALNLPLSDADRAIIVAALAE